MVGGDLKEGREINAHSSYNEAGMQSLHFRLRPMS